VADLRPDAETVAPLVLRCQVSYSGKCLAEIEGCGHCEDGECIQAWLLNDGPGRISGEEHSDG
jgi:hypothetical protein